jgi:tetraacyldisaccharide 4'-kinase
MKLRLILLYPLGLVYGIVGGMRRWLFGKGIFKSRLAVLPSIVVGNLTVGGTGKTPFVVWLAQQLLERKPAILSRGYGRNTKGFYAAKDNTRVVDIGDEPAEIHALSDGLFSNYVCVNRVQGIAEIAKLNPEVELVILDDGFQHLPLKAQASVLLCDYNRPFFKDWPLPAGNLREFAHTAKFSDCIVVTKCPFHLSIETALIWQEKLSRYAKPVFFASYENESAKSLNGEKLTEKTAVILVSALAQNKPFQNWGSSHYKIKETFSYRDHHPFGVSEVAQWKAAFVAHNAKGILTTGKDAVKILEIDAQLPLFVTRNQPAILFGGEDDLIELLLRKIDRHV